MIKKSKNVICAVAILIMFLISINIYALDGKLNADGVNFRKESNTKSAVLDTFSKGDKVNIISKDGNWYKVKSGSGVVGYVSADFIDEVKPGETDKKTENKETIKESENKKTETEKKQEEKTENTPDTKKEEPKQEEKKVDTKKTQTGNKIKLKEDLDLYYLPIYFSKKIKNIKKDDEVNSLDKMGIWEKVRTQDGYEGWLLQSDLK